MRRSPYCHLTWARYLAVLAGKTAIWLQRDLINHEIPLLIMGQQPQNVHNSHFSRVPEATGCSDLSHRRVWGLRYRPLALGLYGATPLAADAPLASWQLKSRVEKVLKDARMAFEAWLGFEERPSCGTQSGFALASLLARC